MMDPQNALSDRNLEANTTLSLKREPACFAFLSSRSATAPQPIDSLNLDLASVDYFSGRASLWATLEIRSGATNEQPTALLGFDETFLRPFTRALIESAASRHPYRMTILREAGESERQRVVEYVTGPGTVLSEVILTPHDSVVVISGRTGEDGEEETLFQLPRSDSFLRAFVKMTCQADQALRDTLNESEKLARRRAAAPSA
ncbi:MAG TPA: hypothetical protein VEI03_07770 [Stellaceae bacterium]|nr:hypothetical protein [Stellaceae bacterium]